MKLSNFTWIDEEVNNFVIGLEMTKNLAYVKDSSVASERIFLLVSLFETKIRSNLDNEMISILKN